MEKNERRLRDNLVTLGTGNILFGVWGIVKITLYCTLYQGTLIEAWKSDDTFPVWVNLTLVWLVGFFDALMQWIIGFSARAEGLGKRKSIFYVIVAILRVITFIPVLLLEVYAVFATNSGKLSMIITLFIEVSSFVILTELTVSAVKIKRLKKQTEKQEVRDEL